MTWTDDDLRMAAEIGAEMAADDIPEDVVRARAVALGYQASDVLGVLRDIRDACPAEWEAIMKTPQGANLCTLWDNLREHEKTVTD